MPHCLTNMCSFCDTSFGFKGFSKHIEKNCEICGVVVCDKCLSTRSAKCQLRACISCRNISNENISFSEKYGPKWYADLTPNAKEFIQITIEAYKHDANLLIEELMQHENIE